MHFGQCLENQARTLFGVVSSHMQHKIVWVRCALTWRNSFCEGEVVPGKYFICFLVLC